MLNRSHQLHAEKEISVVGMEIEDVDHVGVSRSRRAHLAPQPFVVEIASKLRTQNLDGDPLPDPGVEGGENGAGAAESRGIP